MAFFRFHQKCRLIKTVGDINGYWRRMVSSFQSYLLDLISMKTVWRKLERFYDGDCQRYLWFFEESPAIMQMNGHPTVGLLIARATRYNCPFPFWRHMLHRSSTTQRSPLPHPIPTSNSKRLGFLQWARASQSQSKTKSRNGLNQLHLLDYWNMKWLTRVSSIHIVKW